MPKVAIELTLKWLVEHFGAVQKKQRFVWVLGAGASYASRIPLGSQLVDGWLEEMYGREGNEEISLESWATAEQLRIKYFNWSERASFYPQVYQRRFRVLPKEGYDYLETVMANKEPSPGYSILAAIMAKGRHNVVVTTNFDNLVADAISIYTDTFPLVIGHESLAGFADVSLDRPLICKVHRDLLLNPQNDSRSLGRLQDSWGPALRTLFRHFTPFFIGYGGNDATLMGLLESFEPSDIKRGLVWCYYEEKPSERIVDLVADLDGSLVRIPDFDLLMFLLGRQMGITTLDSEIGERAAQRTRRYRDRIIQLDLSGDPSAAKAVAATMESSLGWWSEYQKTKTETDLDQRKTAFENAINQHPDSAVLHGLYANFMRDEFRDFTTAREHYVIALDLDRDDPTRIGDYAFMAEKLGDNNDAQANYERALGLDSSNAINALRFANFLWYRRKTPLIAKPWYFKAAKLDPTSAEIAVDFATFLWNFEGSFIQAAVAYRKAQNLDPDGVRTLTSYAGFRLSREHYGDSFSLIGKARSFNNNQQNQLAAILWFYEAIILKINGRDNSTAVKRINDVLNHGFPRGRWRFDRVLALVKTKLPDRYDFFSGLAKRILKSPMQSILEDWVDDPDD